MRSLIAKEWRESRALIFGFLILAPVASVLIKWLLVGFKATETTDSLVFIIPGAFALFVFALSADLAAADISSGRIAFFAALPTSPAKVWAAKTLFLAGSALLYLGYALVVETMILALAGKATAPLMGPEAARMTLPLTAVMTAGAATFLFSTLIDRGFAAALAGFGMVAGPWLVLGAIRKNIGGFGIDLEAASLFACVVLIVASLSGSAAAFLSGRVHLKARLRRVLVAGLAFLLVLLPATVWAGVSVRNWLTIDAGDEQVRLGGGRPTPDGTWALLSASRRGKGPFGAPSPQEDWAVNLETGVVREFGGIGWFMGGDEEFAEGPGRLALFRHSKAPDGKANWLRVVYDLNTGRPLSTRSVQRSKLYGWTSIPWGLHRLDITRSPRRLLTADGRTFDQPEGWRFSPATAPWGVGLRRRKGGVSYSFGVLLFDTGEIRELSHHPHSLPDDPDGFAVSFGQPIRRIPLAGGETEEIDIGKPNSRSLSPDLRFAVISSSAGLYLVRSKDASIEKIEDETPVRGGPFILWANDSRTFLVLGHGPSLKGTIRDGHATVEQVQVSPRIIFPVHFDGSRVLGFGAGHGSYHVSELDGSSRQLLPVR